MRISDGLSFSKINRLDEFQGDGVLNYNLLKTYGIEVRTSLPEKI